MIQRTTKILLKESDFDWLNDEGGGNQIYIGKKYIVNKDSWMTQPNGNVYKPFTKENDNEDEYVIITVSDVTNDSIHYDSYRSSNDTYESDDVPLKWFYDQMIGTYWIPYVGEENTITLKIDESDDFDWADEQPGEFTPEMFRYGQKFEDTWGEYTRILMFVGRDDVEVSYETPLSLFSFELVSDPSRWVEPGYVFVMNTNDIIKYLDSGKLRPILDDDFKFLDESNDFEWVKDTQAFHEFELGGVTYKSMRGRDVYRVPKSTASIGDKVTQNDYTKKHYPEHGHYIFTIEELKTSDEGEVIGIWGSDIPLEHQGDGDDHNWHFPDHFTKVGSDINESNDFEWVDDIPPTFSVGDKLRVSGFPNGHTTDGYYDIEITYITNPGGHYRVKFNGTNIIDSNMATKQTLSKKLFKQFMYDGRVKTLNESNDFDWVQKTPVPTKVVIKLDEPTSAVELNNILTTLKDGGYSWVNSRLAGRKLLTRNGSYGVLINIPRKKIIKVITMDNIDPSQNIYRGHLVGGERPNGMIEYHTQYTTLIELLHVTPKWDISELTSINESNDFEWTREAKVTWSTYLSEIEEDINKLPDNIEDTTLSMVEPSYYKFQVLRREFEKGETVLHTEWWNGDNQILDEILDNLDRMLRIINDGDNQTLYHNTKNMLRTDIYDAIEGLRLIGESDDFEWAKDIGPFNGLKFTVIHNSHTYIIHDDGSDKLIVKIVGDEDWFEKHNRYNVEKNLRFGWNAIFDRLQESNDFDWVESTQIVKPGDKFEVWIRSQDRFSMPVTITNIDKDVVTYTLYAKLSNKTVDGSVSLKQVERGIHNGNWVRVSNSVNESDDFDWAEEDMDITIQVGDRFRHTMTNSTYVILEISELHSSVKFKESIPEKSDRTRSLSYDNIIFLIERGLLERVD